MEIKDPAHQARDRPLTIYEDSLADALESILERGKHELSEIVHELNAMDFEAPGGGQWTDTLFIKEMRRLGR